MKWRLLRGGRARAADRSQTSAAVRSPSLSYSGGCPDLTYVKLAKGSRVVPAPFSPKVSQPTKARLSAKTSIAGGFSVQRLERCSLWSCSAQTSTSLTLHARSSSHRGQRPCRTSVGRWTTPRSLARRARAGCAQAGLQLAMGRSGRLLSNTGRGALYGVGALLLLGCIVALIALSDGTRQSQFPEGWTCQTFGKGASYCSAPLVEPARASTP